MGKKLPPCKGCEERRVGCHAECERFTGWKAENDQRREEIYAAKARDGTTISDRSLRKHWRNQRLQNRKYLK